MQSAAQVVREVKARLPELRPTSQAPECPACSGTGFVRAPGRFAGSGPLRLSEGAHIGRPDQGGA